LKAKNRNIERACEDTSTQKCISLRNPWVDLGIDSNSIHAAQALVHLCGEGEQRI
jgi:hypothetical protein